MDNQEGDIPKVEDQAAEHVEVETATPTEQQTNDQSQEQTAEPAPETAPEPTSETALQPTSEPASQSVAEPVSEPVSEPASEPASKPASEPASEPAASEVASRPSSEPSASEPASKPAHEPAQAAQPQTKESPAAAVDNVSEAVPTAITSSDGYLSTSAPVLVTGASGFIALHTIKQLLEKGYRVRGTVRSLKDVKKNEPITSLPGASERLELVEADLNNPTSFIPAVAGVEYVLHIASPYVLNVTDPQKDLVDPAVNGTLSVLQAAYDAGTVKRVVLTSSCAAISDSFDSSKVYTEADWNSLSSLTRNPYYFSKTLAEQAAWKFVSEKPDKFDLVVINPFIVLGPSLVPSQVNESVHFYKQLLNGEMGVGGVDLYFGIVDVRDVALAHIVAMENKQAR
jgi:nucleoside-diphosphate-sugar epimerase